MGCRPSKQARSKIRAVEHKNDFPCLCSPRKLRKSQSHHRCCEAAASTGSYSERGRSSAAAASAGKSNPHHHHPHHHRHHHHFYPNHHHHHHQQHRQHGRRSDDIENDNSSVSCHHSYSTGHRPAYSKSADNTDFPAFSTTTAVYRRSASKTSKITLRLSCDGSTLEIEQCDYDLDRDGSTPSPMPRPWSSAPNLTKVHSENVGRLFKNANLPLRKKSPGSDGEGCGSGQGCAYPADNNHHPRNPDAGSSSRKSSSRHVVPVQVSVDVMSRDGRQRGSTAGVSHDGSYQPSGTKDFQQPQDEISRGVGDVNASLTCNNFSRHAQATDNIWAPLDFQRGVEPAHDSVLFQSNSDWLAQNRYQTKSQVPNLLFRKGDQSSATVQPISVAGSETLDEMMDQLERSLEMTHNITQAPRPLARRSKSVREPAKHQFYVRSQSLVETTKHYVDARDSVMDNCFISVNPSSISQAFASTGSTATEVATSNTAYVFHKPPSNLSLEPRDERGYNSFNSSAFTDISPDFERIPVHVISSLIKPLPPDSTHPYSHGTDTGFLGRSQYDAAMENTVELVPGPTTTFYEQTAGHRVYNDEESDDSESCDEPFSCIGDVFSKTLLPRGDILHSTSTETAEETEQKLDDDMNYYEGYSPEYFQGNSLSNVYQGKPEECRRRSSDPRSLSSCDSDSVLALVALGCPIEGGEPANSFMYSAEDKCPLSFFTPEHQISCPYRNSADNKTLCESASAFYGYSNASPSRMQPRAIFYNDTHLDCERCTLNPCQCEECLEMALKNSTISSVPSKKMQEGVRSLPLFPYESNVFIEAGAITRKSTRGDFSSVLKSRRVISDSGPTMEDDPGEMENMVMRGDVSYKTSVASINPDEFSAEESRDSSESPDIDLYNSVIHRLETKPSCLEDFSLCHNKQDSCEEELGENQKQYTRPPSNNIFSVDVQTDNKNTQDVHVITKKDRSNKKMRKKKRKAMTGKSPSSQSDLLTVCTVVTETDNGETFALPTTTSSLRETESPSFAMDSDNMVGRRSDRVFLSPIVTCSAPAQTSGEQDAQCEIPGVQDSADYLVELLRNQDNNSLSPSPRWDRHTRFCYDLDYLKANENEMMSVSDASDYEISPLYYKKLGDPFLDDELDIFTSMYGVKKAILAQNLETSMLDFEKVCGPVGLWCGAVSESVIPVEGHRRPRHHRDNLDHSKGTEKTRWRRVSIEKGEFVYKRDSSGRKTVETNQQSMKEEASSSSSPSSSSSSSSTSVSASLSSQEEKSDDSFSSSTSSSPSYDSCNFIVFRPTGGNKLDSSGATTSRESNEMASPGKKLRVIQAWVLDKYIEVSGLEDRFLSFSTDHTFARKSRGSKKQRGETLKKRGSQTKDAIQLTEMEQIELTEQTNDQYFELHKVNLTGKNSFVEEETRSEREQPVKKDEESRLVPFNGERNIQEVCVDNQTASNETDITCAEQKVSCPSHEETIRYTPENTYSFDLNKSQNNSPKVITPSNLLSSTTGCSHLSDSSAETLAIELSLTGLTFANQHLRNVNQPISNCQRPVYPTSTGYSHPKGQTIPDKMFDMECPKIPPPTIASDVKSPRPATSPPPPPLRAVSDATTSHPPNHSQPNTPTISVYTEESLPLPSSWDSYTAKDQFSTSIDRFGRLESCDGSQALPSPAPGEAIPTGELTEHQSIKLVECHNRHRIRKDNNEYSSLCEIGDSVDRASPLALSTHAQHLSSRSEVGSAVSRETHETERNPSDQNTAYNDSLVKNDKSTLNSGDSYPLFRHGQNMEINCINSSDIDGNGNAANVGMDHRDDISCKCTEDKRKIGDLETDSMSRLAFTGTDKTHAQAHEYICTGTIRNEDQIDGEGSERKHSYSQKEALDKCKNIKSSNALGHCYVDKKSVGFTSDNLTSNMGHENLENERCGIPIKNVPDISSDSVAIAENKRDLNDGDKIQQDKAVDRVEEGSHDLLSETPENDCRENYTPERKTILGGGRGSPVMRVTSPAMNSSGSGFASSVSPQGSRPVSCRSQGDLTALAPTSRRSGKDGNGVKVNKKNRVSWPEGPQSKVLSLVSYFEQGGGGANQDGV
ncbi:hypothetical protein RRG08_028005 [Elysia crispata]|uniref:Uncharacterized protein n=1 Tax=Elysia crispata TaxID=231223 RepID=A0AAE1ED03_9GAST|nr:hypothetical protein RRG08_028005 [Elysia crispata]